MRVCVQSYNGGEVYLRDSPENESELRFCREITWVNYIKLVQIIALDDL